MILVVELQSKRSKIFLFSARDLARQRVAAITVSEPNDAIKSVARIAGDHPIRAIAFRILFGADSFASPTRIGKKFFTRFNALTGQFPFYIPYARQMIHIFYKRYTEAALFAFFEAAFFNKLPREERYSAIPQKLQHDHHIKKTGFHGIAHQANSSLFPKEKRVISVVFEKQTSVCALSKRRPCTISLGYTPLEGIMGRTSCGDIDPGMVFYLMNRHHYSLYALDGLLKRSSGFTGLTGYNLDFEEFVKLYGRDNRVDLAFTIYQNQILKYIGEGIAVLGGLDALIFSGCFLDILTPFIFNLIKKISFLGISLEAMPWDHAQEQLCVHSSVSKIALCLNRRSIEQTIFLETKKAISRKKIHT